MGLLAIDQFTNVRATVLDNNPGMSEHTAGRVVEQAVAFVVAAAGSPAPLAPSRIVDEGWHALILHTRTYADLCARHGRFVHHTPGYDPTHYDPGIMFRTVSAIEQAGLSIDRELWSPPHLRSVAVAANCQHAPECAIEPMPEPRQPGGGAAPA